ncbi:MAG: hypothetical protein HOB84_15170 [Candidatus Marinimicrobia bacterium]|nr:hypothetical protein [Candidatus Neomarinimicrobiota bacterium]MBT4716109.1 hypothetical protein [Candidatus Neomarinimicrobiota bacterium]MBT4947347.1 hypothetical protein [Candidatus Neomarinimicrobiota bacterium]MBT5271239.1 hypothetical protein [Candidatus Neomarinimicrobiota bacterium]MBT6010716.1 hypothetical protein [Candidatus Neomarinimicrobiota bacterium]
MKNITLCVMVAVFLLSCATSEEFVRPGTDFKKYKRIAIFPLTDYYSAPGSGIQVADILSMKMLSSPLQIIDRSQTQLLLQEQQFGLSGLMDEQTAVKAGNLIGVQAILTGSINKWSTSRVNIQLVQGAAPAMMDVANAGVTLKLIDCETGLVIWAGSADGSYTGPNQESTAAAKAVDHLLKQFKARLY